MNEPTTPSRRAGLRDEIAAAIWERQNPGRRYADCEHPWQADAEDDADAVLALLYREWPRLRAEAEETAVVPPAGRGGLRDRIAEALAGHGGSKAFLADQSVGTRPVRHSARWWAMFTVLSAEDLGWLIAHPVRGWHAWQHRNDPPPPRSPAPKIDPGWVAKRRAGGPS